MIATILSWIAGGGLSGILSKIESAYEAKLKAQNDADRVAADITIAKLEAERDSVLAAQSNRIGQIVRALWAAPFIAYNFKLIVYDKMMGLGVTDPLSDHLVQIEMIILGGYFLVTTAQVIRK